jgi:small subunit ribosomal protein S3
LGQKANPIGLRLGIIKGWESNWYGGKDFSEKLVEDDRIRTYLATRIAQGEAKENPRAKGSIGKAGIAKIVIERTLKRITITIHTSRPGIVIGRGGKQVDSLREEIRKLTNKEVQINIFEIKRPELDSTLVGQQIAQQLEARVSFRRAMKMALAATMRAGAGGCKIMLNGRLGGAEMARTEKYREGRVPLQTLRADIDYALVQAKTIYGIIGVKVWIFKKEVYGKVDLTPNGATGERKRGERGEGSGDRRERGGDDRRDRRGGGNDRGGDRGGRGGERRSRN